MFWMRGAILAAVAVGLLAGAFPGTQAYFHDREFSLGHVTADVPIATCGIFWANSTTQKDAVKMTGTSNVYHGCIHSNHDLVVGGGSNVFHRTLRYASTFSTNNNGHTFDGGFVAVQPEPYPFPFEFEQYAPGGCKATAAAAVGDYFTYEGNVKLAVPKLQQGLHYVDGSATVDTTDFVDRATIVATGSIKLSTSAEGMSAYTGDGLLAFANSTGQNVLTYGGNTGTVTGSLYAPNGHLSFSGNSIKYTGQVAADVISASGSGSEYFALAPVGGRAC